MTTYTVFIGGWDETEPDWIWVRVSGLSWDHARERLAAHFRLFADDSCDHCRQAGQDALAALEAASPGYFEAEVDGNDCLIFESKSPPPSILGEEGNTMDIPSERWMRIQTTIRKLHIEGDVPSDPAEHLELGIAWLESQIEGYKLLVKAMESGEPAAWRADTL